MAKRRLLAAVVALLLAISGGLVLVAYVKNADRRAMGSMEVARVLIVEEHIKSGSAAEDLSQLVSIQLVPARTVVEGALTSLSAVQGQVTTSDLVRGEQVLPSRFADPASLLPPGQVKVPSGMQEVSIALDSQRALGGNLTPGDTVGIIISTDGTAENPALTQAILHKVLVSRVSGGNLTSESDSGEEDASPATTVTVTFAVSANDAERVVYAANYGKPWLSLEPADAAVSGTTGITAESVNE
jgi:pilus assembly protein CpaB